MNKEKKNPEEKEKVESKKLTDEKMEQVSGGVTYVPETIKEILSSRGCKQES